MWQESWGKVELLLVMRIDEPKFLVCYLEATLVYESFFEKMIKIIMIVIIMKKLDKIELANMLFKIPLTRKEAYDIIHKPTKKSSKELRKYVLEVFINGCKALLETPNTELI